MTYTKLPIPRIAQPQAEPFSTGSLVALKNCPGPTGIVLGVKRGRIAVRWDDVDYVGRHKASSLVLAADDQEHQQSVGGHNEQTKQDA